MHGRTTVDEKQKEQSQNAVGLAINRAGSARALSEKVGCSYRQVFRWRDGDQLIGPGYAKKVADVSGLDPADFRPDLFG